MSLNPQPLALSSTRLQTVLAHADCVAPEWRSRFIEALADELMPLAMVEDADVQTAIKRVATRMPRDV
jgi:hypothetical protein